MNSRTLTTATAALDTWPEPVTVATTPTRRYGTATVRSWDRMHPRLTRRSAWAEHPGDLPVIEGTVVLLQALPSRRDPKPLWLWSSHIGMDPSQVDQVWWAYLRRFDIEHTFRFLKQNLGWDAPRLRDPQAADRWSWIVVVAYTQLRLARSLVRQVRLPWHRLVEPDRMSPSRVRRGFRYIRADLVVCVGVPKSCGPGPGRPVGRTNKRPAPRYGVPKKGKAGATERPGAKQAA